MSESGGKVAPRKGGRPPRLDPELVAAALAQLMGNVSATAKRFGVDRAAVQKLIGKRPALQRVVADARATLVDHAESALFGAVVRGEAWAVCFALKCQGRDRGYVERPGEAGTGVVVHQIDWAGLVRGARDPNAPDPVEERIKRVAALPAAEEGSSDAVVAPAPGGAVPG